MGKPLTALAVIVLAVGSNLAGESIEFYFFGRQGCGFSQQVVNSGKLPSIVNALRQEATRRGAEFKSICVSLDTDPEAGALLAEKACGGFDQTLVSGEGVRTSVYRELVHSPPSLDGNEIPEGDWPVPLAISVVRRDSQLLVNRWISWEITAWASELEGLESNVHLGDDMKPVRGATD